MKDKYIDFIEQSFDFPQKEFHLIKKKITSLACN